MMVRNTKYNFGLISILLHWLMALVIVGLFASGLWMTGLSYYDPWYQSAPHWHKSAGVLLFVCYIVRVLWRGLNVVPAPLNNYSVFDKLAAKAVHGLIYLGILLVIASGYLISTADGRAISVFGWFEVPAWITGIDNQEDIAGTVHFYGAWVLIALAAGHGLAALKHHFYDQDETLKRMLNPNRSINSKS